MENINLQELEALLTQNITFLKQVRNQLAKEAEAPGSSARDYSKWELKGEWFNKSHFTRAVFAHFIDGKYPLQKLNKMFANTFPASVRGNKTVFVLEADYQNKEARRFHNSPVITADGHTVYVSNQWGVNNWFYLLKTMHDLFHFPLVYTNDLTEEAKTQVDAVGLANQVEQEQE